MVGLAQMVRASDCGPEGRRFDPDIPPHGKKIANAGYTPTVRSRYPTPYILAGIVQRLVCKFSKLEMRFRLSLPAPSAADLRFFVDLCYNY